MKVPAPSTNANPLQAAKPDPNTLVPAYEFLGYLPDSYGTQKLFLVARDPRILSRTGI